MIEFTLPFDADTNGVWHLDRDDIDELGLPESASTVEISHKYDLFDVDWDPATGELRGDGLAMLVEDSYGPSETIALHWDGDALLVDDKGTTFAAPKEARPTPSSSQSTGHVVAAVDKTLTEAAIRDGEISIGPVERQTLDLPEHSHDVELGFEGDHTIVQWHGRDRRLEGEGLADLLQLNFKAGERARLQRDDTGGLVLERVAMGAAFASPAGTRQRFWGEPATTPAAQPSVRRRRRTQGLRGQRFRLRTEKDYRWTGRVGIHKATWESHKREIEKGGWDDEATIDLRLRAEELALLDSFDELLSVGLVNTDLFPWQEAAARTLLSRMRGRGVLADEVGLGKTIEAGAVIKELAVRGLAERVLITCPSSLREQWRDELKDKFGEHFDVVLSSSELATAGPKLIMTPDMASSQVDRLAQLGWDLLIVDEAHKLMGQGSVRRDNLALLDARYHVLLTATPVQNNLAELYRLVELIRPGTFASLREFNSRYIDRRDPRRPVRTDELRQLVSEVMVRTTRAQAGIDRVRRNVRDVPIRLTAPERLMYETALEVLQYPGSELSTMQRRYLALRLVSSLTALARTARKMRANVASPRLQSLLERISDTAADYLVHGGVTSRQQALLDLCEEWLPQHQRILVFSQHTDTVEDILALLDRHGIRAAGFHGSMNRTKRAESIRAFKAGEIQVLVSSDAGAEGQNLQVAYCVVNYDLPWNPMRIEQRIGRVHRLNQASDVVHVANFFAHDTVDERVYALLHDKLAMFELLFGQVTTILGELDRGNSARSTSFEGRVVDAILSTPDEMQRRLDALGEELADARARSESGLGPSTSSLTSWIDENERDRFNHRDGIAAGGATELVPKVRKRSDRRRKSLVKFVRDYVSHIGAEIDTVLAGDLKDHYLAISLPDELHRDFEGAERLHLAFSREGLEVHPEAELCAAGSDVFEELLQSLRFRGDLVATRPVTPELDEMPVAPHADDIRLVSRELHPPTSVWVEGTWKLSTGDGTDESIHTIASGPSPTWRLERVALEDGEVLEEPAPSATELLAGYEQAAVTEFEAVATELDEKRATTAAKSSKRLWRHYEKRVKDVQREIDSSGSYASYDLRERLQELEAARDAVARSTAIAPVRLRAELLTLRVEYGEDFAVRETWAHPSGAGVTVEYPFEAASTPRYHGDDDRRIDILALCSDGHLTDAERRWTCPACHEDRCETCGDKGTRQPCRLCEAIICGHCIATTDGRCPECHEFERVPEQDNLTGAAYRALSGVLVRVSDRSVHLATRDGTESAYVAGEDLTDPAAAFVRSVAQHHALPIDTPLRFGASPAAPARGPSDVSFEVETTYRVEVGDGHDLPVVPADLIPTPEGESPPVESEELLGRLANELRSRDDYEAPERRAVVLSAEHVVTRTVLGAEGLIEIVERHAATSSSEERRSAHPWDWDEAAHPYGTVVAVATSSQLEATLVRVHRSLLAHVVRLSDAHLAASLWAPDTPTSTPQTEARLHALLADQALPTSAQALVVEPESFDDQPSNPGPAELVHREVTPHFAPHEGTDPRGRIAVEADLDVLNAPDVTFGHDVATEAWGDTVAVTALRQAAGIDDTAATFVPTYVVQELWRDVLSVAVSYEEEHGASQLRPRDPAGQPLSTVAVDDSSHLHDPADGRVCERCHVRSCVHCVGARSVDTCADCGRQACEGCLEKAPQPTITGTCIDCDVTSCAACRFGAGLAACALCLTPVCRTCRQGGLCATCATLRPASDESIQGLPRELALSGCMVDVSTRGNRTVVTIQGHLRREVAILRDDELLDWIDLNGQSHVRELLRDVARTVGCSGNLVVEVAGAAEPAPPPPDALPLQQERDWRLAWDVSTDNHVEAGTQPGPGSTTQDDAEPVADLLTLGPWAGERGLQPRPGESDATQRLQERASPYEHSTLRVGRAAVGADVLLMPEGLLRRQIAGFTTSVEEAPWKPSTDDLGLSPRPDVILATTLAGYTAHLVGIGSHALLRLERQGSATWHTVRNEPSQAQGRAIALALGLEDVVAVSVNRPPDDAVRPTIQNARRVTRDQSITVAARPVQAASHPEGINAASATFSVPPLQLPDDTVALPPDVAAGLARELDRVRTTSNAHLDVTLNVTERWESGGGDGLDVSYRLGPGGTGGAVTAADTGFAASHLWVDSDAHLAETIATCRACGVSGCAACSAMPGPCAVCGWNICDDCKTADAPRRCAACAGLARISRSDAKAAGHGLGLRGRAYEGRDPQHLVRVVHDRGTWLVETVEVTGPASYGAEKQVEPADGQVSLLSQLLEGR